MGDPKPRSGNVFVCHSHRVEKLLYLKWYKILKFVAIWKSVVSGNIKIKLLHTKTNIKTT
jgi:hypothetical protein